MGIVAVVGMMVVAPIATAAEFIPGDETSGNVTLSSTETHHNAYTAGNNIFVNSKTTGDLYVAGGTVTIEGSVEQDLVIAAGEVNINGEVGGDIRAAGGTITINNKVGGDIIMAGGTLHLTEKSSVVGDLYVAGGEVTIDGPVTGTVQIHGDNVTLNSTMNGQVKVNAGNLFVIGNKAVIPAGVTYQGVNDRVIKDGAQVGPIDYKKIESKKGAGHIFAGIFTLIFVVKVLGLILAGLLLMRLFPRSSNEAVEAMRSNKWSNLGIGAVALIVVPILSIILMVIFLGFYIGMMAFVIWGLMLMLSILVASVFIGAWIVNKLTKKEGMRYDWQALVIGVIVMSLLFLIPFIGGLVMFIFILMAFGGLIRQFHGHIKSEQNTTPPPINYEIN